MALINTLVFSRWDISPAADEPAHGFFMRLAELEGSVSMRTFAQWNDLEIHRVPTNQLMETLERHPMPPEWFERLRHNTPFRNGNGYLLRGHSLPFHHIRFEPRRWCPGCIRESSHHRAWWEVESIRHCPIHCVELETRDEMGMLVPWTWLGFAYSREGIPLGRHLPRRDGGAPFARYLLGRFGWLEPTPAPLLDAITIPDVIDWCEFVGRFLENPPSRKHPSIGQHSADVGFSALCGDRADLAEAFRAWHRKHRKGYKARSLANHFSWGYPKVQFLPESLRGTVRRAFDEAAVFQNEGYDRRIRDEDFDVEFMPQREIAANLNIERRAVELLAREVGVLQKTRGRRTVVAHAVDAIAAYKETLITIKEAARRLGIHQDAIRHFVHAGYLTVFKGLNPGRRAGGRYSPKQVDAILKLIDDLPVTGSPAYGLTLHTYRVRNNLLPGVVAVKCLKREIVICEKRDDVPGFKRLMVQTDAKRKRQSFTRSEDTMTMAEAQALLNMTYETTQILVKRGHLGDVDASPKQVLISKKAVEDFAGGHAKASDFGHGMGISGHAVSWKMRREGVDPVVKFVKGGKHVDTVFRRADVMRVYGLTDDPTSLEDARVDRFWEIIVPEAAKTCPYLIFPPKLPPSGQRVWNSNRGMSAHFQFDPGLGEIHIELSARGQKHRFWFDLKTEDYVAAIKGMLEVFDRMVKEARERQNEKTREWWAKRKDRR
ncbi:TniQ family protein [Agrobacterium rosae]|uniref:TniQ family protein n=1 Tax=Agrobacterium rosae TaxID=1972867 RepID=UPI003A80D0C9